MAVLLLSTEFGGPEYYAMLSNAAVVHVHCRVASLYDKAKGHNMNDTKQEIAGRYLGQKKKNEIEEEKWLKGVYLFKQKPLVK